MLTNDKRELLVCVFTRRSACNVLSLCVKKMPLLDGYMFAHVMVVILFTFKYCFFSD